MVKNKIIMNYSKIIQVLGKDRIKLAEPMAKHTTYRIGGPADLFYEAKTEEELIKAIKLARKSKIPFFVLGGGSNVLVSDEGFRGLIIKNKATGCELIGEKKARVSSGTLNSVLVRWLTDNGLSGAEFLIGIPGTVGGAIRHNARFRDLRSFHEYFVDFHKVKDCFMGNLVESVRLLLPSSKIITRKQENCGFGYGSASIRSDFKKNEDVILSAVLNLEKADKKAIDEVVKQYIVWRQTRSGAKGERQSADPVSGTLNTQPYGNSAGCVFSNINNQWNHPSGRLIDLCGLKGKQIGQAQISPKHANFIVNLGGASCDDVLELIALVKEQVKKKFGVDLKEEIEIIGEL